MEFNRQTIRHYILALDESIAWEESADIIVPDLFPDIADIVDAWGMAVVKDKIIRDGKLDIQGLARAGILYRPDGEEGLRKIELSLPFSHLFEGATLTSQANLYAKAVLLQVQAHMMNPRKVQVTAEIQLQVKAYEPAEFTVCDDIPDAAQASLQLQKTLENAYLPVCVRDKSFSIQDETEVPGTRPPIGEIVRSDVRLFVQERKSVGSKLVCKGAALIKILYISGEFDRDPLSTLEHEIPFSQILDMDGMDEECDCTVDLCMSGIEMDVKTGLNGQARAVGITLHMEAQAVACANKKIEALSDLYSTAYELTPEFQSLSVCNLVDRSVNRHTVRESLNATHPVQAVLDTQVALTPLSQEREGEELAVRADAVVRVLYIGEDNGLYTLNSRIPVEYRRAAPSDGCVNITADLSGEMAASGTQETVEIRFAVDFDIVQLKEKNLITVTGVKGSLDAPKNHADKPFVVLRRVREGECLWGIAKSYNTTKTDIIQANALDHEEMQTGQLLLIPRKR